MTEPPINIHIHDALGDKDRARLVQILEKEMTPALFKTPDITPAQAVAVVGAIIAVAVAGGLNISQDLQDSIIRLVTILAPILLVSDAAIRHGRATGNAKKGD